jgi:hypothetical protein
MKVESALKSRKWTDRVIRPSVIVLLLVIVGAQVGLHRISAQQSNPNCQTDAIAYLYVDRTVLRQGDSLTVTLSAVNPVFCETMELQLVLKVPSGMIVSEARIVHAGAGQYVGNYSVAPGGFRNIELQINSAGPGFFELVGRLFYFFGDDKQTGRIVESRLRVAVRGEASTATESTMGISSDIESAPMFGVTGEMIGGHTIAFTRLEQPGDGTVVLRGEIDPSTNNTVWPGWPVDSTTYLIDSEGNEFELLDVAGILGKSGAELLKGFTWRGYLTFRAPNSEEDAILLISPFLQEAVKIPRNVKLAPGATVVRFLERNLRTASPWTTTAYLILATLTIVPLFVARYRWVRYFEGKFTVEEGTLLSWWYHELPKSVATSYVGTTIFAYLSFGWALTLLIAFLLKDGTSAGWIAAGSALALSLIGLSLFYVVPLSVAHYQGNRRTRHSGNRAVNTVGSFCIRHPTLCLVATPMTMLVWTVFWTLVCITLVLPP